ncbi:hypothetical protein EV702DRAFT_1042593 [Suillus placidus]|uniref:Uncharacterized protein n=1 Tax=Suillus placidus TaxID=48579 RepID=A0A9P7A1P6_9AGAM|nr:hypothetical protein EV702DRAFT_1042593 [Suillus placidus]
MAKQRLKIGNDEDLTRSIFKLILEDRTEDRIEDRRITVESQCKPNETSRAAREHSAEIHEEASNDYHKLFLLNINMHACLRTVADIVNQLHSADGQQALVMLTAEYETMTNMQEESNDDLNSAEIVDTGPWFKQRYHNANPTILLTMLIALILNVFGHITRPWCNAVLGLLNLLLKTTLGNLTCPTIPSNIHTMFLHIPAHAYKKKSLYPERCTHQRYQGSKPCGKGGKMWMLVRPYVVQDFNAFLAGMFSQPGIEEAMDHGTMMSEKYHMWDIKDGTVMQEISGTDGKLFMNGLKRQDLRLAWSLSVDWFNPHGNKTSGKKKAVGMYGAYCKSNVRTLLAEKVRGHFNMLKGDFRGCTGPTANQMCGLCWQKKSEVANFDYDTWRRCTCKEHRAAAEEWKSAETKLEHDKASKTIRVVRMLEWEVNGPLLAAREGPKMIRTRVQNKRSLDPEELDRGRTVLKSNPTVSTMTRLRVPVLEALIQEAGVMLLGGGKCSTKMKMVEALLNTLTVLNDDDWMPVDDDTFITEELVKQCVAEVEGKNNQKSISGEVLTDVEINQIQAELRNIKRPSWHCGPLKNLGEPEHGKLKAEQWWSAIEFDLPVTLAKLWGMDHMKPCNENGKWRQKLAHNTMLLAMAI